MQSAGNGVHIRRGAIADAPALFYVDSPAYGRGIAQTLMAAVRDVAREQGGTHLWLTVWERNPRAIAFYTKCGFVDVGETVFYVGQDRQIDRVLVASVG